MARNAASAIAWARGQLGSRSWGGRCEAFTRTALGFPGQYPSANAAWAASGEKHPGDFNPPAGVPVFWALTGPNAPYGHVALSIGGGKAISSSNEAGHAVVSVISIRGFTDAYAHYRGWAGVYHGVRLDQAGAVQVGGGSTSGGKHSAAAAQVEEEDMTPDQERKLNRTVEGVDQALRALTQVNNRVYSIEQKVNHSFEADDQSLTSISNVGGRIYQIEQKVNTLVEAVDHMLKALTQINERAYGAYAQSKAALDSLAEVAKAIGERK